VGVNTFFTFLMLLLAASGAPAGKGRGNDLLDLIPTAAYWRIQGAAVTRAQLEADVGQAKVEADIPKLVKDLESLSRRDKARQQLEAIGGPALEALRAESQQTDDPEAAAMARDLITSISARGKAAAVRRLMAIRTLGERKEKESVPALKALLDSREMFVAEYAARALATIDGTPVEGVDHRAELAADLDMLPATTGIVAQSTGLGLPGFNVEALVGAPAAARAGGGGANDDPVDRLTRNLLEYAEAVGNVRADGATLAISADIGGQNEWVLISVRGQYDREAVGKYLADKMLGGRGAAVVRQGDMMSLSMGREAVLLMPSDKQMVFVTANPSNTPLASVTGPLTDALTSGKAAKAGIADNQALADLIKGVDKTGVIWAAAIPSARMKGEAVFAAFDTLTLSAKEEKDVITLAVTGRGAGNAAAAEEQVTMMQKQMAEIVARAAAQTPAQAKALQPLRDALASVKVTVDEKGATATAKLSREVGRSLVGLITQSLPGAPPRRMPQPVIEDFDGDLP
jgi:hypothetical protein